VLVRAFHTSSVRRAPIWLPWASRLMGWFWHSVPEPLKRRLYRLLPRYRILFAVLFATGLWSISHMEVTPVTGRLRFVDVEPSEVDQVMNTARHQLAAQYADSELLHAEPVYRRVQAVTQRLRHVVQSLEQMGLVPHVDFNVFVVHGDELAFSLQTGEIMLFTNLFDIAKDDDSLAYVIGHEMAHCLLSHTSEKMSKSAVYLMAEAIIHFAVASQLGFSFLDIVVHDPLSELLASLILNLPHSRTQEYEADLLGMYLATRACYEPEGGPRFFEGLRLYRYQQMRSDAKKEHEQQQQQQQGQHLQQQGERQIQHTAHVGSDQPAVDDTASPIHRWIRGHIDSSKRYKDFDVITFPRLSEESYSSVNDSTSVAAPTESSSTAQAGRLGDGHADAEVRAVASSPPAINSPSTDASTATSADSSSTAARREEDLDTGIVDSMLAVLTLFDTHPDDLSRARVLRALKHLAVQLREEDRVCPLCTVKATPIPRPPPRPNRTGASGQAHAQSTVGLVQPLIGSPVSASSTESTEAATLHTLRSSSATAPPAASDTPTPVVTLASFLPT